MQDSERGGLGLPPVCWVLSLCFGFLFLLPHLVRIQQLGSYAAYSPFTAHSESAMTWDETFLYGAEANYTLTRGGSPASDDTWEHRHAAFPYSIVPMDIEALTARLTGLKTAHLIVQCVFPALSLLVLMAIFTRCGAEGVTAALLAGLVLVVGTSPGSLWAADRAFLHHQQGSRAVDLLWATRTPNPSVSFLPFLLAFFCLAQALRYRGEASARRWAIGAGLLGGLLFYCYIYLAIPWAAAVGLLAMLSLVRSAWVPRVTIVTLLVTLASAAPFLWWKHLATAQGSYQARTLRLGMAFGHGISPAALRISVVWGAAALVSAAVWMLLRRGARQGRTFADSLLPVLLAGIAGSLAGLNMQVVTGLNVQPEAHFTHEALRPLSMVIFAVLIALMSRSTKVWRVAVSVLLAMVVVATALGQFEVGRDTAERFRVTEPEQKLFAWLDFNTPVGAVVATDDLALSVVLPVRTHTSVLFSNGSRGTASDEELMERFLFTSRLTGASAVQVAEELSNDQPPASVPIATYSYYLFETSAWKTGQHISASRLPALLEQFQTMNLADELRRFRVDYVRIPAGREPPPVNGWEWTPVLADADGRLWRLTPA